MRSSREILELAAKAAGIRSRWNRDVECLRVLPGKKTPYGMTYNYWDPLADDGAALRLSAQLGMSIYQSSHIVEIRVGRQLIHREIADGVLSRVELTRRAITYAAAEIGKAKP